MGAVGTALVGPAVSGLFGLAGQRHAENRQDSEIQRRVEDGRRAGLSPLASVGASTAGSLGDIGGVAATGSALGDAIGSYIDRDHIEEKRKLENDLLRAQIKQSNAGAEADLINARSRTLLAAAAHPTRGVGPALGIGGIQVSPTAGYSDAQKVSDRYGDVIGELVGLGNAGADAYTNASSRLYKWWHQTADPHRAAGVVRSRTGIDPTVRRYRGTSKM